MGRIVLVFRLALRDLRRRRTEAALLLIAVLAATTTLTLGLVVRDAASDPYASTRAATNGPDVLAGTGPIGGRAALGELATTAGVTGHNGPFPVIGAKIEASGRTSDVQVLGRDAALTAVDQPEVTQGRWVSAGGVVLEAAFAGSLGVRVGDPVTVGGTSFEVVGVAVSAAMAPYPGSSCLVMTGCFRGAVTESRDLPAELLRNPGLVWLTQADVLELATDHNAVSYVMSLELADPDTAQAFADQHADALYVQPWQSILADATELARDSQILLLIGAWLLGLLAVASLAVLVGGRMADQTRRVGLLKAIGGTPGLVAAVLLAEYLLVAVVAAAAGLAIGALTAPLLAESSAGLLGSAGASLTWSTIGLVTAVALGVAVLATLVPAVRAARLSTVRALADAARPAQRTGWLIAASARLPVPLLLALRVAARRPRRVLLGMVSIAVTVTGIYVLLVLNTFLSTQPALAGGYTQAQVGVLRQVLGVWTVILLALAAVNAVVITWATVLDNRHASALARALGATPQQVTVALAAAQVLPALAGAVLGIFPGGWALFAAIMAITGGDSSRATLPVPWQLVALVAATVVAVAALTAVPARLGGRQPVTATL
jgi:putative ABC transport system permease protein